MNPHEWADPDEVGSSEYRAVHEHAMSVWNSNEGQPDLDRCEFVRSSLVEMKFWVEGMLKDGMEEPG